MTVTMSESNSNHKKLIYSNWQSLQSYITHINTCIIVYTHNTSDDQSTGTGVIISEQLLTSWGCGVVGDLLAVGGFKNGSSDQSLGFITFKMKYI